MNQNTEVVEIWPQAKVGCLLPMVIWSKLGMAAWVLLPVENRKKLIISL